MLLGIERLLFNLTANRYGVMLLFVLVSLMCGSTMSGPVASAYYPTEDKPYTTSASYYTTTYGTRILAVMKQRTALKMSSIIFESSSLLHYCS